MRVIFQNLLPIFRLQGFVDRTYLELSIFNTGSSWRKSMRNVQNKFVFNMGFKACALDWASGSSRTIRDRDLRTPWRSCRDVRVAKAPSIAHVCDSPCLSMRNNALVEHCVAEEFILHREIVLTVKANVILRAYLDLCHEYCAMKNKQDCWSCLPNVLTAAKRRPMGFGVELCQLALPQSRSKSRERDLNVSL